MKKITLSLALFLTFVMTSFAQVTIGSGNNEVQNLPFEPYYGYTYSQSIYLASEINASGTITSFQWYYSGTSTLSNNQQLVVYFGQTDYDSFASNTDFIAVDELTQVYSGGITVTGPGWVTITLDEPFVYDGTNNLVVAVDENMPGYNSSGDDFYNSAVVGNRSIYSYSDSVNTDPADPATGSTSRGAVAFVPNIIFGGITQACTNPTQLASSNITTTTASFAWLANAAETEWEVLVLEDGSDAPDAATAGTAVTGGIATYTKTELEPATIYQFYVRAKCSESLFSSWVGPLSFKTQCLPFDDFFENFNSTVATGQILTDCWAKKQTTTSSYAYVDVVSYNASSTPNAVEIYNSDDANAQLYLITPGLTSLPANTHRVKFKARGASGWTLIVGTMSDPSDAATFTAVQTINLTSTHADYNVVFNSSTTDGYVAFKHGLGGTYRSIFIDDVLWEPIPTVAPDCVTDSNVTPNESCGNFASSFAWSAVEGADGYKIVIGTTPGANDVVDNVNVGNVLTYSFTGNHNTTYYYKVIAYNAVGDAVDCGENEFTTAPEGCYCTSVPTSNDGAGITNVQINDTSFANGDVTYFDYTEEGAVDLTQNVNNILNITFATGYTYHANVWIDYNDNYTFEASELVFSGQSTNVNPVVFDASFLLALTSTLGEHRMRIGTADSGQATPNPCYSGSYGITLDFTVNIIPPPACLPPTSTSVTAITANGAQLNWVSEGTLFNVEYGEAGFEQGSGIVVSGVAANLLAVSELNPQTDYGYYIQTDCGAGSLSPWTGPYTFRTACEAFDDFTEAFTTDINITAPECWYTLKVTSDQYAGINVYNYNDYVQMYNSGDAAAQLYLITPSLNSLPLATHRIKFTSYSYAAGASIIVGTMSDPTLASSFTAVQTIPVNSTSTQYSVSFTTATTDQYVAFKFVGTGSYQYLYIDNVVWEPSPTTVPECVTDVDVATNADCGNFASSFTWSAVEGADFYNVTIGTVSGEGTTVNVGNATSYSFTGNFNTTYFYTVTSANAFGPAVGCIEGSFTTSETGCYCTSLPTSNDNSGITNVLINDSEFSNPDVTYSDYSGDGDITLEQGQVANVQISFATGYTYNSYVFIDLNDNYSFEQSEQIYTGESLSTNPTVLDASFTLPADAPLGVHRMRLVTYDYNPTPLVGNPCYSASYGVTIDFNVNVEEFLSVGDFANNNFKVYPNPVKDVLNLSYTQSISNVEVFNLLGQQVISKSVNANQSKIDMSDLSAGTYLVKVTADNQVKTIKVIKQ